MTVQFIYLINLIYATKNFNWINNLHVIPGTCHFYRQNKINKKINV